MKKNINRNNTVISILYESQYFHRIAAISYGIQFEPIPKDEFERLYNLKVFSAGLFVDPILPYLAASPNGLIGDNCIIEIKCPFSIRNYIPEDAYEEKKLKYMENNNEKFILKRNHDYYYQVQGQLHITQKLFCYFVIWTPKGICVDKIERDDTFWQNKMEMPLSAFYLDHMIPEIISPQLNNN